MLRDRAADGKREGAVSYAVHGSISAALLALPVTGASPITSASARNASLTPVPVAPDSNSGVFFAARFSRSYCFFRSSGPTASI